MERRTELVEKRPRVDADSPAGDGVCEEEHGDQQMRSTWKRSLHGAGNQFFDRAGRLPAVASGIENTQDQEYRMDNSTTRQDSAAMPPASAGAVAAWAVMDGTKTLVGYHSCSRDKAEAWAREYGFPEVVPLYRQPTSKAVRLPQTPDDFEISEANGYAAAIVDFKRALTDAGIEWTEQPTERLHSAAPNERT